MTTETKQPHLLTWDLESIFPGGSHSEQFSSYRRELRDELTKAARMVTALPDRLGDDNLQQWADGIIVVESLYEKIELVLSFAVCLASQNIGDTAADKIMAEADSMLAEWKKLIVHIESLSLKQSDEQWATLTSSDSLKQISFYLAELRTIGKSKMSIEKESLALDLAVDGYHGWNRIYDKMAGELKVEFNENGSPATISLGQLATKMSSSDRAIRSQAFEKMTEAWKSRQELAAMTLNNLGGFRLGLYRNRGWKSPMFEPLQQSRITEQTLDAMWAAVERETPRLKPYIEAKKKLGGIDRFRWYDQFAPIGMADKTYSYDEACNFVVDNVRPFSSDMADFCRMAIDQRWVEAEDRPGKRGGGFCTGMGPHRQSRIFMTYAGTYENLLTLAHELGHAYHSWVLRDTQFFATDYPMTLAETASTFAEAVVTDAALERATDRQEKLMLLDQKLQAAYTMFCDLQSRYRFERSFYEERANGMVDSARLSELMIQAQKRAFGDMLDESGYHPLFWCSKLHFFITEAPFYNFPYVFGYLFSAGVYAQARTEGTGFAEKYRQLLMDTGKMTAEELASKHLGVDLTTESFWKSAIDQSLSDVGPFVELANEA